MASELGKKVNNEIYHELGERWYQAQDDPIALLRAESRSRNPWIAAEINRAFPSQKITILDVGCGAGFLANDLAQAGFELTGLDASAESLQIAKKYDRTNRVQYEQGNADNLPYPDESFNVCCAMDFLEHVDYPAKIIAEIGRVLKPGGLFFFHTFNRNFLSWLVIIKGVEWFVKNTPPNLHRLDHFIKPSELHSHCQEANLCIKSLFGFSPDITKSAFWKMALTGNVDDDFQFKFTSSHLLGYIGFAVKN